VDLPSCSAGAETTAQYLARKEKERQAEEEIEADPDKVKEMIDKAFGRMPT
jgi:hypothetical protein